ncbi:unnamed protein product [Agarophyton chilense]
MTRSKSTRTTQGVIRSHEKGRRHLGLKDLKPTNPLYRKLLSYRYYRLADSSSSRTPQGTGKVKDCIKIMGLTLRSQELNGEDPKLILYFLGKIVQEADIFQMNEAQAYISLPYFLKGMAEDQHNSVRGSPRASEGRVTSGPEAVQYLLRSYATGSAIQDAILALRDTKQKPGETETVYSTRLDKAFN